KHHDQSHQYFPPQLNKITEKSSKKKEGETIFIGDGDEMQELDYILAPCCNPIPGDDIFGFLTVNEGIKIHRTSCPNASKLMANYGYRILKAQWSSDIEESSAFIASFKIVGIDDVGLIN